MAVSEILASLKFAVDEFLEFRNVRAPAVGVGGGMIGLDLATYAVLPVAPDT